ncbi:ferritin-like domain-containing protein [Humisphaera borealis]|uniref:Ferritin-like domain-containing protein n=1 Tax=Humisphaera borealis TaxID=2807512 RepID=A0A7M2X270_9BACT|nr:ferritin-like domain-containing protein [Humisphaera borealis]QOV91764.1 ferritin-like domain-containing protein [Humisphaera borealis]
METLEELFQEQIKDLYSAENQLLKAMPKMVKKASSEKLARAIEDHRKQTEQQVERLKKIGEAQGFKLTGKVCNAMKGLIEEATEAMQEGESGAVMDAAIVADAQRIEHYEISAYGTARSLAEHLGDKASVKLLEQTLKEEGAADEKLTKIVMSDIYPQAQVDADEMASMDA